MTTAASVATATPDATAFDRNATEVTTRTDLSILYRIVRTLIRPLRPKLIGLNNDPFPAGSPQLHERPQKHYGVNIKERAIAIRATSDLPLPQASGETQTLYLYDFEPHRTPSQLARDGAKREYRHTVYYFAGGGFTAPASAEHWKLCARMAKDLAGDGVRVVNVSYPLAPTSPAKDSLPLLRAWLMQELHEVENNARAEETMSLMGDSAGGNVVLSLGFWWAQQSMALQSTVNAEKVQSRGAMRRLRSVITLSPPTDFRNVNPEIAKADSMDPVLTTDTTQNAANSWCKDWSWSGGDAKADPVLSPVLHNTEAFQNLKESGIQIDGLYGTADVLAPDCKVFMERCQREGIRGKWLVWEGQMHCFPLTICYGLSEGREGYTWLTERIREVLR